jgi:peptidoglycan/xylan/chitin deacetylase (PgdA/CDA1 family)
MKRFALRLMQGCGMFAAARAMSAPMARILMFHNFSQSSENKDAVLVTALRSQFQYLRRHFSVVPLHHIIERLKSGERLHNRSAVLTIDDGRHNCYELMFPLLKEFEMPATFFVVSSFISGQDWIWTDKVLWLSEQPRRPNELAPEQLGGFFERLNQLRPEVRQAIVEAVATAMGVEIPREAPPKYAPCSWKELREMADSGLVEIGSHSVSHPIFASVTDQESWQELIQSRRQIGEGVGKDVRTFCFPNGQRGDYRPSQVRQVEDAGYTGAVAAHPGMVGSGTDPYELPRIGVSGRLDALDFSKNLDGAEHYQLKLQRSLGLA